MSITAELIERLRQHADTFEKSGFAVDGLIKDYREAADTIQCLSEKLHASQTEFCEDAISRQAVLDLANNMVETAIIPYRPFQKAVKALPSIQPKQKEITMEDVTSYCEARKLVVISKDLFSKMNNTADEMYLYLKDRERR